MPIAGANKPTYQVRDGDRGKSIYVVVTVKPGNTEFTGNANSSPTSTIPLPEKPDDNGCEYNVLNCKKCKGDDRTYCEECNEGYGLRGGYCSLCGDDLYVSSTKPCLYDCSAIRNCYEFGSQDIYSGSCTIENGQFYCLDCASGYYESEDHRSCIKYDERPFSCSEYYNGCLECNEDRECIKCDTDSHWVLNNDSHSCYCESNKYQSYDGKCLEIVDCDEGSNCNKCLGPNKICVQCNDKFGLENGKCTECGEDLFSSIYSPCYKANCPDANCAKCRIYDDGDYYCVKCKEGFNEVDDKCINTTLIDCPGIFGCSKCYAGDTSRCAKCNETQFFKNSRVFPGTCVCDVDHELSDGKCVRPKGPYVPPRVNKSEMTELTADSFNKSENTDGTYNLTLAKGDAIESGKTVYFNFDPKASSVTIPPQFGGNVYYFELKDREKPFTVQLPENTVADIECKGATINVPSENKININGAGEVKLNSIGDENSVKVNNVKIQPDTNYLVMESDDANITMLELDVSGVQSCTGQRSVGDKIFQTICRLAKVEADSSFKAYNLKFENIKVGLRSLISMDTDSVIIDDAPIDLYHLSNKYGNQNPPLQFIGTKPPGKPRGINILPLNEGEQVPSLSEDENFTVASFNINENIDNASRTACEEMKKDFKGGEGFSNDENSLYCVLDEDDKKTYTLVATKTVNDNKGKDKDGLSGGAIAGIVIACVVVVAAIIALLVYFLVIKKRNQSTTSTQGDSSIAI